VHLIWLRVTQIAAVVPLLTIIYMIRAVRSYGTKEQTAYEWFGGLLTIKDGVDTIEGSKSTFQSDY